MASQASGKSVSDICREHSISQGTFLQMEKQILTDGSIPGQQLKDLKKELAQYKKIVAELTLQKVVLKDVFEKKL